MTLGLVNLIDRH